MPSFYADSAPSHLTLPNPDYGYPVAFPPFGHAGLPEPGLSYMGYYGLESQGQWTHPPQWTAPIHQKGWDNAPQVQHKQIKPTTKEDKPVGGVSATLDYEMETMTDFVTEMAAGMYALFSKRICVADIDLTRSIQPGIQYPPAFRKWVLQVLNATRLPSATILLSLSYLALRIRGLSSQGQFKTSERGLYQMLTISLVLGSKFLDDNTFQNKSWAEVSHISTPEINHDEREWLEAFNHRLHNDLSSQDGFNAWKQRWETFETHAAAAAITAFRPVDTNIQRWETFETHAAAAAITALRPVDTNIQRNNLQQYGKPTLPSFSMESNGYPPMYDSWSGSPSHTGHDYYGYDRWDYQGRNPYRANMDVPLGSFQSGWNCHGPACQCASCRQNSFMRPRYGPIAV